MAKAGTCDLHTQSSVAATAEDRRMKLREAGGERAGIEVQRSAGLEDSAGYIEESRTVHPAKVGAHHQVDTTGATFACPVYGENRRTECTKRRSRCNRDFEDSAEACRPYGIPHARKRISPENG